MYIDNFSVIYTLRGWKSKLTDGGKNFDAMSSARMFSYMKLSGSSNSKTLFVLLLTLSF